MSDNAIWHSCFSPGICRPEQLEKLLVRQQGLLDRILKDLEESFRTDAGHHWLLIGPRGIGKTHLLSLIVHRAAANPAFRDRFVIACMKEEERGVRTFLDWIVRILRAFESQGEVSATKGVDLQRQLADLVRVDPGQARVKAVRLLDQFVGDRKILLVAENLEKLFSRTDGMNRQEQRRFRDLVQKKPSWAIIASCRSLFEDIRVREAPFYGFFRVQHLIELNPSQSLQLVTKLARLEGRAELAASFQSNSGHGQIRALHHLTGGNPRLLVCFYQNIDGEQLQDLATPFLKMVDNLTAYYHEQFLVLPNLQQKIVEFLCYRRTPVSVKEIAQNCFVTHSTAASQLKRLSERNCVRSTRVGRNSFYELRDPLLRICSEFRENRIRRIRLFVDFLEKTHHVEELQGTFQNVDAAVLAKPASFRPDQRFAIFSAALASFHAGRLEEGLDQIKNALATGWSKEWEETAPLGVYAINLFLLTQRPVAEISQLCIRQQKVFKDVSLLHVFAEGLIAALLRTLSRPGNAVTLDRLIQLRDHVVNKLASQRQFQVACQLFSSGVRFLESEDHRILLSHPMEERAFLKTLLESSNRSP